MMELPLVVGVDGSEAGFRATDWAADEALRHGLPLRVVYASLWQRYEGAAFATGLGRPDEQVLAENIVGAAAERVRRRTPDVKVVTDVLPEDTVGALLKEGRHAFALVTGSRGRGDIAGLLLGSVSLAVAARASCPVIVVRGDAPLARSCSPGPLRLTCWSSGRDAGTASSACNWDGSATPCCITRPARSPWCPSWTEGMPTVLERKGHPPHPQRDAVGASQSLWHTQMPARPPCPASAFRCAWPIPSGGIRRTVIEGPARDVLLQRSATTGLHLGRVNHALLHYAQRPVAVVPQRH